MIGAKPRRSDGPLSTSFLVSSRNGPVASVASGRSSDERLKLGHRRTRLGHELAEVGRRGRKPVEQRPAVGERRAERTHRLGQLRLAVAGRREKKRGAVRGLAQRVGIGGKRRDDALPLADERAERLAVLVHLLEEEARSR